MGQIIAILSGKGGVGKTTITALLGALLHKRGHKVLLTDADFGMRDLDLVLGLENDILFDAVDAARDKACLDDALVELAENFHFLPASQVYRWEDVGRKSYRKLLKGLSDEYDYILIDGPAGIGRGSDHLIGFADRLVIVTQPLWVSLRDAGRLIQMCNEERQFDYALVFNTMTADLEESMQPVDLLNTIGADYMATLLPYFHPIIRLSQQGLLHELDDENYLALLNPLADFIESGDVWDEDELLAWYREKVTLIRTQSIGDARAGLADIEELAASREARSDSESLLEDDAYAFSHEAPKGNASDVGVIQKGNHLLVKRR